MQERIRQYWNDRAKQHRCNEAATTDDIYLRELEISTILQTLHETHMPKKGIVLDIGCGDGYSTIMVAQAISHLRFLGIDYSEEMIENAHERLKARPELRERVEFMVGDVTELDKVYGESTYDIVISDRCLINLGSATRQRQAIDQIAVHTKHGGLFIALENFMEGHDNMNEARREVGLPEIPVRWHNLYFRQNDFVCGIDRFFEVITFKEFSSSYYFATRVIYSAMCQMLGEEPRYDHEIHQLAVRLPWIGNFSPIRMAVLRRKLA